MPKIDVGMTYEQHHEATQIKPIPEDDYELEIRSAETHSSEKGNLVLDLGWVVINNPDFNGRMVFDHLVFGFNKMDQFCEASGFKWDGTGFDTEDLPGLKAVGHVVVDTWKDAKGESRVNNKIQSYLAKR